MSQEASTEDSQARSGGRILVENLRIHGVDTIFCVPGESYLDVLDADPTNKRLAWRYGISKNVLEKPLRVGEVANWIECQVLPTRAKRGRG